MIRYNGEKTTANRLAKQMVASYGFGAYYWSEKVSSDDYARMTQPEVDDVTRLVDKHQRRVEKLLGCTG